LIARSAAISVVASTEGGMDIETVAHDTPEKIVKQSIDPASGYQSYEGRKIAFALGLTGKQVNSFVAVLGWPLPRLHRARLLAESRSIRWW